MLSRHVKGKELRVKTTEPPCVSCGVCLARTREGGTPPCISFRFVSFVLCTCSRRQTREAHSGPFFGAACAWVLVNLGWHILIDFCRGAVLLSVSFGPLQIGTYASHNHPTGLFILEHTHLRVGWGGSRAFPIRVVAYLSVSLLCVFVGTEDGRASL